jgi:hypothetical protein
MKGPFLSEILVSAKMSLKCGLSLKQRKQSNENVCVCVSIEDPLLESFCRFGNVDIVLS